jgi:colicin import membrane protein
MSTIHDPRTGPAPGSQADPFRYGWRYVARKQPDGRVEVEQVPLTLEDLLFPEEGDQTTQFPSHVDDCFYLKGVLETRLAGDPEAVVLTDCRVDWNLPGVRPLGPDLSVFLGVPREFDRGTLGLAEEGARPVLVVEVTSPDTRKNDFGIKKDFYHRAGVPLYVIVDARPGEPRRVKLHGFRHQPGGYEPMPLDDRGRLWLEPMGLWLTIADLRVIAIDGETGEPIGGYVEQVQARIEAEARARTEAEARAIKAEARIEEIGMRVDELSRAVEGFPGIVEAQNRTIAELDRTIAELNRTIETQARLVDLQGQIRDILETKLRESEVRLLEAEAELRRPRGED